MLDWLRRGARVIETKLEARLRPVEGGGDRGEVEWKCYRDGGRKLKVRFRDLDGADGTTVAVLLADEEVGRIQVSGGRGKLTLREPGGRAVPTASAGQEVEVRGLGGTLLRGTLRPD